MAWSESARRAYYVAKYGDEEGEERFQAWMLQHDNETPKDQDAPKAKARPRSRAKQKLDHDPTAQAVAIGIATADKIVAQFLYPPWREEQLTDEEIGRLAHATADEIIQSETLTRWFLSVTEFASKGGAHTRFAIAVAYIMYPRMVARGMLPDFLGQMVPSDAAADMEGRGAHGDHRPDRFGQVDPDVPMAGDEGPLRRPEVEGGFDEVPEVTPLPHGRSNGRHTPDEDRLEAAVREAIAGVQ
jgi:hypothetical protein